MDCPMVMGMQHINRMRKTPVPTHPLSPIVFIHVRTVHQLRSKVNVRLFATKRVRVQRRKSVRVLVAAADRLLRLLGSLAENIQNICALDFSSPSKTAWYSYQETARTPALVDDS